MTTSEAQQWARLAAIWVCAATPGKGSSPMLSYMLESVSCCFSDPCEALYVARRWVAHGRVYGGYRHTRQARLLLIFVRRLARQVKGYEPPACGRCSDTGVEFHVARPDCWPVPCSSCRAAEHEQVLSQRLAAQRALLRYYGERRHEPL